MRQGVTVWYVLAFPEGEAYIEQRCLADKPKPRKSLLGKSAFVEYYYPGFDHKGQFGLLDCHVMGNQTYNWHRLFFSRRKAESYAKLVRSGCDVSSMFGSNKADRDRARQWKYEDRLRGFQILNSSSVVKMSNV